VLGTRNNSACNKRRLRRDLKLQTLRRFFPLLASLPPLDELPVFTFTLRCTFSESVEVSSSSISFTLDEPGFNFPAPLTSDLPPLFEALPLALEDETFGVSCLDLEILGVLVPSSFDLLVLDVKGLSFFDLLAVFEAKSDLLPLLGV